jgi:hypothetical protein
LKEKKSVTVGLWILEVPRREDLEENRGVCICDETTSFKRQY